MTNILSLHQNLATRSDPPEDSEFSLVNRAYLIVDVIGSTNVSTKTDDISGYFSLRAFLDSLCITVHKHSGEIVKTLGDGLEAAFENDHSALSCALTLLGISTNPRKCRYVGIRVALTSGRCIKYRIEGRTDYFGRDVILASKMSRYGTTGGVRMSAEFAESRETARRLSQFTLTQLEVNVPGFAEPAKIYELPVCQYEPYT